MNITVLTAGNLPSGNGDARAGEVAPVNTVAVAGKHTYKKGYGAPFLHHPGKTGNKAYIGKEPTRIEE